TDNTVIKCGIATCGAQTQWQFTVNTTGIAPPQGTGPQSFTQTFTISGSTQTLTFTGVPTLGLGPSSSTLLGQFSAAPMTFANGTSVCSTPPNQSGNCI